MSKGDLTKNSQKYNKYLLLHGILGDIAGRDFEFRCYNTFDKNFDMFQNPREKKAVYYTDDTICTLATVPAIIGFEKLNTDKEKIDFAIHCMKDTCNKEFKGTIFMGNYGGQFREWLYKKDYKPAFGFYEPTDVYDKNKKITPSAGDGAAMKVGAVANAYSKYSKTMQETQNITIGSHPAIEGVKGAKADATAIYLSRAGRSKAEIKALIETQFDYDLDIDPKIDESYYKDGFDPKSGEQSDVCPVVVPQMLRVFLNTEGYENCLRSMVAIGGDSDTTGIMIGHIAGAFYGMPEDLAEKTMKKLDDKALGYVKMFQDFVDSRNVEPDQEELDSVIARAMLESYVLQEEKKGHTVIPSEDPKYLELMLDMEGKRLLYEQIEKAEADEDKLRERMLRTNKAEHLAELKKSLRNSSEFMRVYQNMKEPQTKVVPVKDYEANKRIKGYVYPYPTERTVVKHELIPEKIVTNELELVDIRNKMDKLVEDQKKGLSGQQWELERLKRTTLFSSDANSKEMLAVKENLQHVMDDRKKEPENRKKLIQDLFTLRRSTNKYISSHSNKNDRYRKVEEIGSLAEKQLKEQDPLEVIEALSDKLGPKANSKTMEHFQSSLENFKMAKESKDPKTIKSAMDQLEFYATAYKNDHSNHNERYDIVDTIGKIADKYILTKGRKVTAQNNKKAIVKNSNSTQQKKSGQKNDLIGRDGLNLLS